MWLLEILLYNLGGLWQAIRLDFNLLEIAAIAALAFAWKRGWRPRRVAMWNAPRPALVAVAMALSFVALRIALIPLLPIPIPVITDESSHLLLADTLLHGRVTNPTHPFWPHFESIHILMKPHYVSVYFPGQALWLAAGRFILNSAWSGVLAECGVFLVALYWMLRGWMPAKWALFGVLLAGLRFAIGSYWVNAFHGGFLAAMGGALVAGAFIRLRKSPGIAQGLVFGCGLAILIATRPIEGAIYSVPFIAVLAWEFRRNALVLLAAMVPVSICAATLGIYFSHITGSPLVTPYQLNQKLYGWPMTLAFMKPPLVQHSNIEFAHYYEWEMGEHQHVDGPIHFLQFLTFRLQECWRFFLGPALSFPLIMLRHVWRRQRMLVIGACGGLLAVLIESTASPHYLAPATAVILAIVVECCRHLRASRVYVVKFLPIAMALTLTLRIGARTIGVDAGQLSLESWCCRMEGNHDQARIAAGLQQIPGRHLVFVRPKVDKDNLLQWIYNDADIDAARIVWARDLGPERNAELAHYYTDRAAWIVDPNVKPAVCRKY